MAPAQRDLAVTAPAANYDGSRKRFRASERGSGRWRSRRDVDAWAEMAAVCPRAAHHVTPPSKHPETFDTRVDCWCQPLTWTRRGSRAFHTWNNVLLDADVGLLDKCLRWSHMWWILGALLAASLLKLSDVWEFISLPLMGELCIFTNKMSCHSSPCMCASPETNRRGIHEPGTR